MTNLTLGTAKITIRDGLIVVNFMGHGNFTVGEQIFGNNTLGANAAMKFCRDRGFRVLAA